MSVYNSSVGAHEDDSDITIINPSIITEHNDEQVTNSATSNTTARNEISDGKSEYIFVDHNPHENVKQLEQVLMFYIRDLKQESNTQLDCDKQLITRLMDLIRPAYPTDQKKMIELDKVVEEIASLNDKRHVEQKEKVEQLRTEICQLNKMLLTKNDSLIYNNNNNKNDSMFTINRPAHSIHDYDQWTEIEDDAKKLHEIVQSQKDQINEIVSLISQAATASADIPNNDPEDSIIPKQSNPTTNKNVMSSLLQKIQTLTGQHTQQDPISIVVPQETPLENHSPGTSPSQSLATLTLESLQPTLTIHQTQQVEEPREKPIDAPEPIREEPRAPIDIPVAHIAPTEKRKCPVCNEEFPSTTNDEEVYDHIEKCLFPSSASTQPKEYECPNCNRKLTGIDETIYLQHLTDCYNRFV